MLRSPGGNLSIAIVTTVSRSYVPLARILMRSVAQFHPDARRVVVQLDGPEEEIAGAEVIRPSDLITDPHELAVQAAMYHPIEFATALKPRLLMKMLETADVAIFLDPDMQVFHPLTVAIEALESGAGTLLTPHRVTAPDYDNRNLYEWGFKAWGAYNTAFVGVTASSLPFLTWWDSRLSRDCLTDVRHFHWVDQRIVDLAPSYFDIDLLKDLGYNVCWWNLEERPLKRVGSAWTVGGVPLVVMHFSGVRPGKPKGELPSLFHSPESKAAHDPDQVAAVTQLEDQYVADLLAEGSAELSAVPYGLGATPGGRILTRGQRQRYRNRVLAAEARGDVAPLPDDVNLAPRTVRDAMGISLSAVDKLKSKVRK